jgi:hypothetical protein
MPIPHAISPSIFFSLQRLSLFVFPPPPSISFKVASLDVMAVGAPAMNVADIVTNIIKENVLKVGRERGREGAREGRTEERE